MLDWGSLLDDAALASVVPDEYARFREPIRGALALFLAGLAPPRQAAVLAEQASLPATASAARRLALLARGCPSLHKLGQVLARDPRLSPEFRGHLQELESLPAALPLAAIQAVLAEELGPLERLGVTLVPPALAEASVAVVIPFRDHRGRDGVFKVLKPGVVERLEEELALFERVGSYLDESCQAFHLPNIDYRESFEQVRDKLRHEVRFDLEQRHLAQAKAAYEGDRRVLVPALMGPCTGRVTAMERVTGGKVTDHVRTGPGSRRLAELVVDALIARPVFSRDGAALFHADPHAGNLFLTEDGRLAILDWSLVGWLGERERVAIAQVLLGALTLDPGRAVDALAGIAARGRADRPALESLVRARLGRVPGFAWLLGLLDQAVQSASLRLGGNLMLFRKALHTLEGVVADVSRGGRTGDLREGKSLIPTIDKVLLGRFLQHFALEWPLRWLAPPESRAFATRLSNRDLVDLTSGLSRAVLQLWLGRLPVLFAAPERPGRIFA